MRPADVPIPERMQDRPRFGPYPVPFVTAVIHGRPDFKVHDNAKRLLVARRRLCQLCGKPLEQRLIFVGLPPSIEGGVFGEPPMHPSCAGYAFEVCPWLLGADWRLDPDSAEAERYAIVPRPEDHEEVGIWNATGYVTIPDDEGSGSIKWKPTDCIGEIEWRSRG